MAPNKSISDPEQMKHFGAMAEVSSGNLSTELGLLVKELQDVAARWQGQAGTAFGAAAVTVDTEQKKLVQALSGIATDVKAAGFQYQVNDDEGASSLKSSGAQLTGITSSLVV